MKNRADLTKIQDPHDSFSLRKIVNTVMYTGSLPNLKESARRYGEMLAYTSFQVKAKETIKHDRYSMPDRGSCQFIAGFSACSITAWHGSLSG